MNSPAAKPSGTPEAMEGWVTVKELDGRVTAKMPAQPKIEEKTADSKFGPIQIHSQKALVPGVVWNVLVRTFPEQMIATETDKPAMLERLADISEKQKPGAIRDHLNRIDGAKVPEIDHRFHYQFGKNKAGQPIDWFSIHHHYLVGTSVVTLFIDVQEPAYKTDTAKFDREIAYFFGSAQVPTE